MWSPTRQSVNQFLTVCFVVFGTNFLFYSISVENNIEDVVQEWINETFVPRYGRNATEWDVRILYAVDTFMVPFGALCATPAIRPLAEGMGRRGGLMLSCVITILGSLLASLAHLASSVEMAIAGRFLLGASMGLGTAIATIFLTEILPTRIRGWAGNAQQVMVGLGNTVSMALTIPEAFGTKDSWPLAVGFPLIPAALLLLYLFCFCRHDTPNFQHVVNEDPDAAERSLHFFQAGVDFQETARALDEALEKKREEAFRQKVTVMDIFRRARYRRILAVAVVVQAATTLSGVVPVMSYSTKMFTNAGVPIAAAQFGSMGVSIVNAIVPLLTMPLMETLGRRALILIMLFGCIATLLATTVFTAVSVYGNQGWSGYVTIACLVLYRAFVSVGRPAAWIATSELFETRPRAAAVTITSFVYWGMNAVLELMFPIYREWVPSTADFVVFIVPSVACLIYLYLRLPETKGRQPEETALLFAEEEDDDEAINANNNPRAVNYGAIQ